MPEDKKTAVALAKHAELGDRTPIILGGHEHDLYIDEAGKSVIVKVGQDAERIAFIDIWWTAEGKLRSQVQYLPCVEFEVNVTRVTCVTGAVPAVRRIRRGRHLRRLRQEAGAHNDRYMTVTPSSGGRCA